MPLYNVTLVAPNGDEGASFQITADSFEVKEEFTDDGAIDGVPTPDRHTVAQNGVRFYAGGNLIGYVDDAALTVVVMPAI